MTDWTIVVTTLGASGITGFLGYASARFQAHAVISQVVAENDRLKLQHREDHLRNRQSTYHEFLDEAATFERMTQQAQAVFGREPADIDEGARLERNRRFRHLLNGVRLFGTEEVRVAAERVQSLHDEIEREWWVLLAAAGAEREGPPGVLFPQHRFQEWEQTIGSLVDAMRGDVAPEGA
jgi:hypothetical protein